VKYSVESKVVKCGVQRMACGGWTVEYGVWRVKCIKCSVLCVCGVQCGSVECGVRSLKCRVQNGVGSVPT